MATAPGRVAGLPAARGLGDPMAARSDGNPFVSTAGRKMRVGSSAKVAIGDQLAAARARGVEVVETTDSPEPLWSL